MKTATQHPRFPDMVQLPSGKSRPLAAALREGYTVTPASTPGRMTDASLAADAARYRAEVMALPEAADCPITAERIANAYSFASLLVARAAAVLRGLPSEIVELSDRAEARRVERQVAAESPRVRRAVELRMATLSHRLNLDGDPEARRERAGLALALATASEHRIPVTAALSRLGIDAAPFTP